MTDEERPNALGLVAVSLSPLWLIVMMVGLYGAAFDWRPGAYFMITALLGYIASHLLMGIAHGQSPNRHHAHEAHSRLRRRHASDRPRDDARRPTPSNTYRRDAVRRA